MNNMEEVRERSRKTMKRIMDKRWRKIRRKKKSKNGGRNVNEDREEKEKTGAVMKKLRKER